LLIGQNTVLWSLTVYTGEVHAHSSSSSEAYKTHDDQEILLQVLQKGVASQQKLCNLLLQAMAKSHSKLMKK